MFSVCKWRNAFSDSFVVASGVRQGGVLSAKIFAVYLDKLLLKLRETKIGCYIADKFVASVLYADDLCLLAPTRKALQVLLNTCSKYAEYWCIKFNEKKTKVMIFGKDYKSFSCHPILLNDKPLECISQWKYLGITVKTDKCFSCSAGKCLASFYRSINTILNVIKKPSEVVMMKLLYSVCIPILTYAWDIKVFSSKEMKNIHVAINDAIRKTFTFHRWV